MTTLALTSTLTSVSSVLSVDVRLNAELQVSNNRTIESASTDPSIAASLSIDTKSRERRVASFPLPTELSSLDRSTIPSKTIMIFSMS